jgi:hypothetical protein
MGRGHVELSADPRTWSRCIASCLNPNTSLKWPARPSHIPFPPTVHTTRFADPACCTDFSKSLTSRRLFPVHVSPLPAFLTPPSLFQHSRNRRTLFRSPSALCSISARLGSLLSSRPLRHLSSLRTTPTRSPSLRSLVRTVALSLPFVPRRLQSVFAVADPSQECTTYSYPPTAQLVHNFPTLWQPAKLLENDTAGQALWSKIAGSIPNIAPKGQLNGSTINVTYDNAGDPDCCESHSCSHFNVAEDREPRGLRSISHVPSLCHERAASSRRLRGVKL